MSHKQAKAERQTGKQVVGVIQIAVHADANISLNSPLGVKETLIFLLKATAVLIDNKIIDLPHANSILSPNDLEKANQN